MLSLQELAALTEADSENIAHQQAILRELKTQFHCISEERCKEIIQRLNHWQLVAVYTICLEGKVLKDEIGALESLGDVLMGSSADSEFGEEHACALILLMANQHRRISTVEAGNVIRGLKGAQLQAIADICREVGFIDGMGDALRDINCDMFTDLHKDALVILTTNKHRRVSVAEAIATIQGLNQEQLITVHMICFGRGVLDDLGEALRMWRGPGEFAVQHRHAFSKLIRDNHSPIEAIDIIQEMDAEQVSRVTNGETRSEILQPRRLAP